MAFFFLFAGIPVFIAARRQTIKDAPENPDKELFTKPELAGAYCIAAVCAAAVILYFTGIVKL
jgi:hypothetical protein